MTSDQKHASYKSVIITMFTCFVVDDLCCVRCRLFVGHNPPRPGHMKRGNFVTFEMSLKLLCLQKVLL